VDRPAQDASVDFSGGSLHKIKARTGRQVQTDALRQEIATNLAQPTSDRRVPVSLTTTRPKITTKQVARKYPTVITINRSAFRLTLYKHLKVAKTYTIAVGRQGLETPAGEYPVVDKQINPSWHVPHSAWAGSLAGRVIPPGPADPLKARWIGITGGAGIHGTEEIGSLGSAASHGCIRMAIPDVIELFDRTPYGSKIFIQ
jgi:lipoprotein-anchoring transpeptidase ErfK/SrfK